ncbi:MAG: universal stress protein [Myxococcota bacterium]
MSSSIRRILCPTDFSKPSEHAVKYAANLAKELGAKLQLLHVYEIPTFATPDGAFIADAAWVTSLLTNASKELDRASEPFKDDELDIKTHTVQGSAHAEIVHFADRAEADLIVMATHGRSGLSRFLMGSVAERVVRTSNVPVLTVHSPEGK